MNDDTTTPDENTPDDRAGAEQTGAEQTGAEQAGAEAASDEPQAGAERTRPFGYWIRAVDRLLAAEFATVFADEGIDRRDWRLLNRIDGTVGSDRPDGSARPLRGRKMFRLIELGWIERTAEGWTLTDAGRLAKERLGAAVEEVRGRISHAVAPEEFTVMADSLEKIAREFGWHEGRKLPRRGMPGGRRGFGPRGFGPRFVPGFVVMPGVAPGFGPGFGPRGFGRGRGFRHGRPEWADATHSGHEHSGHEHGDHPHGDHDHEHRHNEQEHEHEQHGQHGQHGHDNRRHGFGPRGYGRGRPSFAHADQRSHADAPCGHRAHDAR